MWDPRDIRGHSKKLKKTACRGDVKKYSFPNRSIEIWNSLDKVVVQAKNIHDFKAKLDTYMETGQHEHGSFPVKHN